MKLQDLTGSQIMSVSVSRETYALKVEYFIPADGAAAVNTEEIAAEDLSPEFDQVARDFVMAALEEVRKGSILKEVNCSNCVGACCGSFYSEKDDWIVPISEEDIERAGNLLSFEYCKKPDWWGAVGYMKMVQREYKGKTIYVCPKLMEDGRCSIYEYRPDCCKQQPVRGCKYFIAKDE